MEEAGKLMRGNVQSHPRKLYLDRVSASLHTNAWQLRAERRSAYYGNPASPKISIKLFLPSNETPHRCSAKRSNISDISRRHKDLYRGRICRIYSDESDTRGECYFVLNILPVSARFEYVSRQSKKCIRTRRAQIQRVRSVNNAELDRNGSHKRVRRWLISSSRHFEHRKSDKPMVSTI